MLRPRLDSETMDSSHLVGDEPNGIWRDQRDPRQPHLLYIGGEDHHLRIPAMCALRDHGFRITAVGSGDPAPFVHAGIRYRGFKFDRFVNPRADLASIKSLAKILVEEQPDLAQSFDTKPSIYLPLAARSAPGVLAIRTINGRAFLYSSRSPLAMTLRPVYRALHKLAARTTAATVFEISDDRAFFERHGIAGKMPVLIRGAGVDVRMPHGLAQPRAAHQGEQLLLVAPGHEHAGRHADSLAELGRGRFLPGGDRDAERSQQRLGLIFMDVHRGGYLKEENAGRWRAPGRR